MRLQRTDIALLALICSPLLSASDFDADGVDNLLDNCFEVPNPDQLDSDGDQYGNRCDADFNNDNLVNFTDLQLMKADFFSTGNLQTDLNGDGLVNFDDLSIMRELFFGVPGPSGPVATSVSLQLSPVFSGVGFQSSLMMLRQAPGQSQYWYAAERDGRILRFDNVALPGTPLVVLDISDRVDTEFEGGLLGFAFHPQFQQNGKLVVSYTTTGDGPGNPLDSRLSVLTVDSEAPHQFDPDSELVVLQVDQPYANHNGGDVHFGADQLLYWSLGDGGSFGDPGDNSQDITNLLGAILRIDIDVTAQQLADGVTYLVPEDNPMASSSSCATGCPELYAWGFRNVWRFSFDKALGSLYAGDVGQSQWEEIDLVQAGKNYGWRCYEGNAAYNLSGCAAPDSYAYPLLDYSHAVGSSVTGGYVYRGAKHPELRGLYLYGDFISGRIWALVAGQPLGELVNTGLNWVSFAEGQDGELYAIDFAADQVYRIEVAQ